MSDTTATVYVKHNHRTTREGCQYCGDTNVYWFHDLSQPNGKECGTPMWTGSDGEIHLAKGCGGANGKWVLVNATPVTSKPALLAGQSITGDKIVLHRTTCKGGKGKSTPQTPAPAAELPSERPSPFGPKADTPATPKPAVPAIPAGVPSGLAAALELLMGELAPKVDEDQVRAIVEGYLDKIVFPTRVVVEKATGDTKVIDGAHERLPYVIMILAAKKNAMLVGPAGTGKSTLAESAAEALGLRYFEISLCLTTTNAELRGYMNVTGDYVRTPFREAYENGGLFNFDEIDNSNANILAVMNSGLAGKGMSFPDGYVRKHPDFRCVATANTYGRGADRQYVGRQQMDAATLDRFFVEDITIDEALETAMCMATGAPKSDVDRVLTYVRKLRASAEAQKMRVVVSPRASLGMCEVMIQGIEFNHAAEGLIFKGMSAQDRSKLAAY